MNAGLGDYLQKFVVIQQGDGLVNFTAVRLSTTALKNLSVLLLRVLESIKNILYMFIPHIQIHPLLVLTRRKAWK